MPTIPSRKRPTSARKTSGPDERFALTNPQTTIYRAGWEPENRFRVAVCGRRFGKTFLMVEEIRRAARMAVKLRISPDEEIWYGAPTLKQAKRVMWRRLKRGIPEKWIEGKPNETELSITLRTGHVIRLVGLNDYDNLRGSGLWFFGGDEWADCPPAAWDETISPMLSTAQGHALFIGTPKGFDHFRDFYILGQTAGEPGFKSFLFTTRDGGNVPESEIQMAMRTRDEKTFRQEFCATFETFSGRVIYGFMRGTHVKACPLDPARPLHIGIDFNINPMSATVWQIDDDGETIRQVGEIVLPSSNTDEMAQEIVRRYGRPKQTFSGADDRDVSHITMYPDPAGAQSKSSAQGRTDISILRSFGLTVNALTKAPLVRDRINVTNARFTNTLGEHRAFVDPACTKSIECYERLQFKPGSNEIDKESGYDHLVDGSGYFIFTRFGRKHAAASAVAHMNR